MQDTSIASFKRVYRVYRAGRTTTPSWSETPSRTSGGLSGPRREGTRRGHGPEGLGHPFSTDVLTLILERSILIEGNVGFQPGIFEPTKVPKPDHPLLPPPLLRVSLIIYGRSVQGPSYSLKYSPASPYLPPGSSRTWDTPTLSSRHPRTRVDR